MKTDLKSKIVSWPEADEICSGWRQAGQRICFTNGCFDIIHKGHVVYLAEARSFGDKLVVGLNSDASTSRLKGANRPINGVDGRAYVLAGLASVDLVVVFEEDTPADLIALVKPDVLIKGGDYKAEEIVGYDFVTGRGGEVQIINFIDGYSTSSIEDRIRNA